MEIQEEKEILILSVRDNVVGHAHLSITLYAR